MTNFVMHLRIFSQFFRRDVTVFMRSSRDVFINYMILYPVFFAIGNGYIFPKIAFGATETRLASIFMIGSIITVVFVPAFHHNFNLIFDFENERYIDFQIMRLHPKLVLLERVLFTSLITWINALPFFPIAKLLLRDNFVIPHVSWLQVTLLLYMGALFSCCYNVFAMCFLDSSANMVKFWLRFNNPMISLGGFLVPWATVAKFSTVLGYVLWINPMLYFTEGLRSALIGGPEFFSVSTCIFSLFIASMVFLALAFRYFKIRTDHI